MPNLPRNPLHFTKHTRKCLRCNKDFQTIDPKNNRICPKCSAINRDQPKEYPIHALPHIDRHE